MDTMGVTKVQNFENDPPKKKSNQFIYNEEESRVFLEEIKVWQSRFGKFTFCDWISWFMWINFPNIAAIVAFYGIKDDMNYSRHFELIPIYKAVLAI